MIRPRTAKTLMIGLVLSVLLLSIASRLFSQDSLGASLPVIEYNGQVGVFVPQDLFREVTEDREKGFTYYANWTICETQLSKAKAIISNHNTIVTTLNKNFDIEKAKVGKENSLRMQCVSDRDGAISKYENEKSKNKILKVALPIVGGAALILGGYLGYNAGLATTK